MLRSGYTLMELMITLIIIAIVTAVGMPQFTKTVERARWNEARDTLLSIYSGQRTYSTVNDDQYISVAAGAAQDVWRDNLYMDNPNNNDGSITYSTTAAGATFTATATRNGGPFNGRNLTINQNRIFGGNWAQP